MSTTNVRTGDFAAPAALTALRQRAIVAGVVAGTVAIIGAFITPEQFFRGYLMGFMWCLGLSLGSLVLLMIGHMSGGNWWMLSRRVFEAATRTLPMMTVLFIPVIVGMKSLFVWTHADLVRGDHVLMAKAPYLNLTFFIVRAVIYFAIWNGLAYFLNKWSAQQDADTNPNIWRRMKTISAIGLVLYAFTITLATVDWLMSLDPHWYSTIYGMLFMDGHMLSAISLAIVALVMLARYAPMNEVVLPDHLHDLGKLSLAFVMIYAYFSFSQWLIIWMANLPEEIVWYLDRIKNGWQFVALALIALHFVLPFALLLSRDLKRSAKRLVPLALLLIFMRLVDLYWLVAPNPFPGSEHHQFQMHWTYLAAPAALMSFWVAAFLWNLSKRPLLAVNEPQLPRLWERSHGH
ncbi:MAG TPA: hypothetical protein VN622_09715 [Clostridia bacterium]|nr:hypothetical protein [Clostridia bacterium]